MAPATLDDSQFEARLRRWRPDVLAGLEGAYDAPTARATAQRLEEVARTRWARRGPELRALDYARLLRPDRWCSEQMVGYAAYADGLTEGLPSSGERLDYLAELGVTYLRLLPPLPPPPELAALACRLRERGISLALDLTSGPGAGQGETPAREVGRLDPGLLVERADRIVEMANLGVEVLRLGAVACPGPSGADGEDGEDGADGADSQAALGLTQALRAVARIACPALAFEAADVALAGRLDASLGRGRWAGRINDLAPNEPLMVQIWSALATKDARLAERALSRLPAPPVGTAWVTYLRCPDDITWSISDADAADVGWEGPAHREFLSRWFTGEFPGSRARGVGVATGDGPDRRVRGTAASLAGLEADEEGGDVAQAELDLAALRLAHAMIFGWCGIPVIWSGDELALLNDRQWARRPGHADDGRWLHRPSLGAAEVARRHDATTSYGRAFGDLAHLAAVRARLPHLHAAAPVAIDETHEPAVLAVRRTHPLGTLLQLYNVSPEWRFHPGARLAALGLTDAVDALTGQSVRPGPDGRVWLPPYAAWWLVSADAFAGTGTDAG